MPRAKPNKSEAIRNEINANKEATISQIVESLGTKRIKVSPQLVSNVKTRMGAAKSKRRGRRPGRNSSLTVAQLEFAANFAKNIGGIDQALAALSTLEKLR